MCLLFIFNIAKCVFDLSLILQNENKIKLASINHKYFDDIDVWDLGKHRTLWQQKRDMQKIFSVCKKVGMLDFSWTLMNTNW